MEPTAFYVGLYFLLSVLHLASSRVDGYGGWNNSPDTQYHIQTDEGEERYFKYQTKTGQYRKEKRLQDGTVVGTYGWVDPNGFLRLRDYVADNSGYRIVKTKMVYVGGPELTDRTVAAAKSSYPTTKFATVLPSQTQAFDLNPHRFAYVPPSTYHPSPPAAFFTRTTPFVPGYPETPAFVGNVESFVYQSTPASTYLRRPGEPSPLLQFYPSSTPIVDVSPNSLPKVTAAYASSTIAPIPSSTPLYVTPTSTPAPVFVGAKASTVAYASTTPSPVPSSTPSPSVAVFSDPSPKPLAVYTTTPRPVAVNYVSTPSPSSPAPTVSPVLGYTASTPSPIPAIGYTASTPAPVSGKFLPVVNNNYLTDAERTKYYLRDRKRYVDHQEYDGISTVQNGFRYFLPRHYHEEESSPDGRERSGSFGYIDPFGIRRVVYYNASPNGGFVHRKNNRYVGFDATPYDPRPTY